MSIQEKLRLIELWRSGKLTVWEFLDKLGIPKVGNPPKGAQ